MKKHNITFFDLETTGLNVKECGIVSIYAINYKKKITIDSLINPEMDIPIEASNVHGILENDIKDKPIFKNIIKPINYLFPQSEYVCGYNICRFDIPLLISLYERHDVILEGIKQMKFIDLFYIIKRVLSDEIKKEIGRLTLENVYNYLTGKELDAHNAKHDVIACVQILKVLDKHYPEWQDHMMNYEDLPGTIITNPHYTMKFGKHIGESISSLITNEKNYLRWLKRNNHITLSPEFVDLILENNE